MTEEAVRLTRVRTPRHQLPEDVLRLQAALLPTNVPLLPRVDVAARYVPAGDPEAVGGDWFDAASPADGRLVLSVGDVVGCGLDAVAVMGQLRAVLSARLFEGAPLSDAVDAVELLATRTAGAFATTLVVASIDPSTGALDYLTRGHPAPLVLGPAGARQLPETGDGPLGTRSRGRTGHTVLTEGETVLLYSDGLYEAADLRPDLARKRVCDVAAGLTAAGRESALDRFCADLTDELGVHGFADDVTLLAARFRAPPAALEIELAAAPERLGHARAAVGDWAEDLGLAPEDRRRLVLGVSELVANAVEHGYEGQESGPVRVSAELTDAATVRVVVGDEGTWREPTPGPGERGRGLSMSAALGLRIELGTDPGGTRATIETPARRPLRIRPGRARQGTEPEPARLTLESSDHATVRVTGPLTSRATCLHLVAEVRRAARNGLVDVELDLRRVSHLGSTGVSAIESLLGPDGPGDVRVIAAARSATAETLILTGTPFEAVD